MTERGSELVDRILAAALGFEGIDEATVGAWRDVLRFAIPIAVRAVLVDKRGPSSADRRAWRQLMRARIDAGDPADQLLRGVQVTLQEAWAIIADIARAASIDPTALVEASGLMMTWANFAMEETSVAYREHESDQARADERHRSALLHDILTGSPGKAVASAREVGLRRASQYVVVRARPRTLKSAHQLEQAVRRDGGVTGAVAGDVIGISPTAPSLDAFDGTIGLGRAGPLEEASSSFALAGRALDAATAFGRTGIFSVDDLGIDVALASDRDVGELVAKRYVTPLARLGQRGDAVLQSVGAYLANGMRNDETARALHVHVNTLHYRLRRFEQLTGADLRVVEDVVAVWWALRWSHLERVTTGLGTDSPPG